MTTQPGNTPNISLGNLDLAQSFGITKKDSSYEFLNYVSEYLGTLNKQHNPPQTQVNRYTHNTKAYSNTEYGRLADQRIQLSLDKVASSVIEDALKEKLANPNLSSDNALKIYQGLQSSGKIPTNASKVFGQKLDDYSNANIAAVLESASEKDIKEAYGEDSELTKLILKGKSKSSAAKRFNHLVSMGDEMFDQVHKLDKNSNLAKNFVFKPDGAVFIKRSDELKIDDDMKPFVEERKASLEMYKDNLKDLVSKLSVDELNQAYNRGSQSTLPRSRPSTSDSYSSSNSYPANMPAMHYGNSYASGLYRQANNWVKNAYQPHNQHLRLNYSQYNDPLRTNIVSSNSLFNNDPYGLNTNPFDRDYNAGWNPAG